MKTHPIEKTFWSRDKLQDLFHRGNWIVVFVEGPIQIPKIYAYYDFSLLFLTCTMFDTQVE
jgi:hypothetical protein